MNFSIKGLFSKCDQILSSLRIWPHLLKKSLMENFIFCAVIVIQRLLEIKENKFSLKGFFNCCNSLKDRFPEFVQGRFDLLYL